MVPPNGWVRADPESPELLAFLLKRIKGLNKLRLVDAALIWTEPHSKRLKVRIKVQQEVWVMVMTVTCHTAGIRGSNITANCKH